jgi:hypothetical protein
MDLLDKAIASGQTDAELQAMLAWYRDAFGHPFDHFGPLRFLDRFIMDVTSDEARTRLASSRFAGRGQLGLFWSAMRGV